MGAGSHGCLGQDSKIVMCHKWLCHAQYGCSQKCPHGRAARFKPWTRGRTIKAPGQGVPRTVPAGGAIVAVLAHRPQGGAGSCIRLHSRAMRRSATHKTHRCKVSALPCTFRPSAGGQQRYSAAMLSTEVKHLADRALSKCQGLDQWRWADGQWRTLAGIASFCVTHVACKREHQPLRSCLLFEPLRCTHTTTNTGANERGKGSGRAGNAAGSALQRWHRRS